MILSDVSSVKIKCENHLGRTDAHRMRHDDDPFHMRPPLTKENTNTYPVGISLGQGPRDNNPPMLKTKAC